MFLVDDEVLQHEAASVPSGVDGRGHAVARQAIDAGFLRHQALEGGLSGSVKAVALQGC